VQRNRSVQLDGTQQQLAAYEPQVSRQPPGSAGSHSTPAQMTLFATPQLSTHASGWAQFVGHAPSAFPHSSMQAASAMQTPTVQGTQAPLPSQTSPSGQAQLVPPQLSRQLALSEHEGTQVGGLGWREHPKSAIAPASATTRVSKDALFACNGSSLLRSGMLTTTPTRILRRRDSAP